MTRLYRFLRRSRLISGAVAFVNREPVILMFLALALVVALMVGVSLLVQ